MSNEQVFVFVSLKVEKQAQYKISAKYFPKIVKYCSYLSFFFFPVLAASFFFCLKDSKSRFALRNALSRDFVV